MNSNRRDALSRIAALAAAASVPGIPFAQGAGASRKLKLAATNSYTQQPIVFGVEKGFFREEGLEVEFVDAQDAVTGVATGELSFAFGPTSVYLRAAALGAPIKIVSSGFRSKGPYFLIARPGIPAIAGLKGKTVGNAQAGSNLDTVLRTILVRNGLDPRRDVTLFANGSTQQAYGTLISGQVDATIIHQPFAALGELEKTSRTLARGWDYLPTYHTGVLIAGDRLIAADPDLLRRGLRAYFKSYAYAKAHYPEYLPWLQARLKLNPRAVELALKQEDDIWDNNPDVDPAAIEATQRVEIAQQNQKVLYDAGKYIDLRFLPREYVKPFVYPNQSAALKG
ncbi:hypothetical protein CDO44_24355 [Pigmentiphaga sp. NML080357]|mgnify:CR=1 FL=1|uniref:ABC transporter substrate-binding protein n=1 Tax=Pigmentiphaga sp. NML080357 TaxID=2008675 RepID=UPI000B417C18|nr:ABC transporter substrate-binding protein [Pigmentiphaga sp. NML080357]OVZ55349.1 hypothetical protein CDO44_24355 [Pigmentiphaga sp. NML080357]